MGSEEARDQHERAHGTWALVVREGGDAPPATLRALCSVLRIKRFEVDGFRERLPGIVRRGARVDLVPLRDALLAAGVRVDLVLHRELRDRSAPPGAGPEPS